MSVKRLFTVLYLAAFGVVSSVSAQTIFTQSNDIAREQVRSRAVLTDSYNWLQSSNPSAIGVDSLPNIGITQLGGNRLSGDNKFAQESGTVSTLGFNSDSYCRLKNINLYGRFQFSQEWHKDRRWVDNFESMNDSPYLVGGDLLGSYTRQIFDFSVMLSSHELWHKVVFGLGVDYKVGDFSRGNDPRSRAQLADYNFRPGAVWRVASRHRIGVNGIYRRNKEKLLKPVSKAENADKYVYYLYEGIGEYSTTGITFFNRRTTSNYYGGALQYGYSSPKFAVVADGEFTKRKDEIIGDMKSSPGDYQSKNIKATVKGTLRGDGSMNSFCVTYKYVDGYANSYLQEQRTVINDKGMVDSYWETILSAISYKNTQTDINVAWRYYAMGKDNYRWYVGANAMAEDFKSHYVLPASAFEYTSARGRIECGAVVVTRPKWSLDFTANGGYLFNLSNTLNENEELAADKLTVVNEQILEPNMDLISRNAILVGGSLNCQFKLSKSTKGFVNVYTQHNILAGGTNRYIVGASAGIFIAGGK